MSVVAPHVPGASAVRGFRRACVSDNRAPGTRSRALPGNRWQRYILLAYRTTRDFRSSFYMPKSRPRRFGQQILVTLSCPPQEGCLCRFCTPPSTGKGRAQLLRSVTKTCWLSASTTTVQEERRKAPLALGRSASGTHGTLQPSRRRHAACTSQHTSNSPDARSEGSVPHNMPGLLQLHTAQEPLIFITRGGSNAASNIELCM